MICPKLSFSLNQNPHPGGLALIASEHLLILSLYWVGEAGRELNARRHQSELAAHKTQKVGTPGPSDGFLPLCPLAQGKNPMGAGRTSEAPWLQGSTCKRGPKSTGCPSGSAEVGAQDPHLLDTEAPQRVLPLVPLAKIASQAYVSPAEKLGDCPPWKLPLPRLAIR